MTIPAWLAITILLQLTCHTIIHCVDGGVLSPVCQIPILSSGAEAGTVQCSDGCMRWAVAGHPGSLYCSDSVRCCSVQHGEMLQSKISLGSILPGPGLAVCPVVC